MYDGATRFYAAQAPKETLTLRLQSLEKSSQPKLLFFEKTPERLPSERSFEDQIGRRVYWHLRRDQGILANAVYSYKHLKHPSLQHLAGLFVYNLAVLELEPQPPFCDRRECQACPFEGEVTQCFCGRNWQRQCLPTGLRLGPRQRCPDCLEEQQFKAKTTEDTPERLAHDNDFWDEVFSTPGSMAMDAAMVESQPESPFRVPETMDRPLGVDPQLIQTPPEERRRGPLGA